MATTGTTAFDLDVREISEEAFERIDIDKQRLTGDHMRSARRSMNLMFRSWDNFSGVPWKASRASQALTASSATVTMPADLIDITSASLRRSNIDVDMVRISESDYQSIPDKTTEGRPDRYFMHKLSPAILYLWQTPENSTDTFEYWGIRRIEDISAAVNNTDTVQRWLDAVCANLTLRLFDKLPFERRIPQIRQDIKIEAIESLDLARDADRDRSSVVIIPSYRNQSI